MLRLLAPSLRYLVPLIIEVQAAKPAAEPAVLDTACWTFASRMVRPGVVSCLSNASLPGITRRLSAAEQPALGEDQAWWPGAVAARQVRMSPVDSTCIYVSDKPSLVCNPVMSS